MTTDPYKSTLYQRNRIAVLEAANYQCQVRRPGCQGRATTADHIVPLKLGGSHDQANLRAACWRCNSSLAATLTNQLRAARRSGRRSRAW